MDSDRWATVERLFHEAVDMPSGERAEFLARACGDDEELRSLVESMLEGDEDIPSILEVDGVALLDRLEAFDSTAGQPGSFGPYEIIEPIGRGGMGVVYLARRADGRFDRTVALKVVRTRGEGEQGDRWFRSEARILARLEHPNIARLYDVGIEDGQAYIVMEHVDGERLDRYCDAHRLDIEGRLRLFLQVCDAVAHAHRHLVVHRDLKPSNILVTNDRSVRLLDFGISSLLAEDAPGEETKGATVRALTPEYSSPEQILGEPATTASDVYSLGVVLYESLTGARPHGNTDGALDLARAVVETDPSPPSRSFFSTGGSAAPDVVATSLGERAGNRDSTPRRLARALDGDLDAVVLKALAREAPGRYASVTDLADDIARYLDGRPVLARRHSATYRVRKFARRHVLGVAASAALFVGLVGGLGLAVWQARVAASQRDVARAETARAERMRDFLVGVFMSADPTEARADTITGAQILERGAERIRAELATEPELQAAMLDVIGQVYTNLSQFERAEALLTEGLEVRSTLFGPRSVEVARSVDHLASLARARNSGDADSLSAAALERLREALGPDHPEVAAAFVKAAERVMRTDRDSAERLLDEAARAYARAEGEHALDIATMDYTRGWLHHTWGEYDSAIELYRDALAVQRERLGPSHPLTLTTQHNLGYLLQLLGRYGEADSALSGVLEARRGVYGEDHYKVANTLWGLADLRHAEGRLEEAERLVRQALAIRTRLMGEDAQIVMDTRLLLASVLEADGRMDEAAALFATVLEHAEQSGGGLVAARTLNNFAGALESRGDLEGAESLYRRSWSAYSDALGPAHPFTAIVQGNVASVLMVRGDLEEAEPLNRAALEVLREAYGNDHPTVAVSRMQLGALECARGDFVPAEALLREAMSTLERTLPEGHWRIGQANLRLGTCLRAMNRLVEAESVLASSRAILDSQRYVRRGDWRKLLSELFELYRATGREEEAAEARALFLATEAGG